MFGAVESGGGGAELPSLFKFACMQSMAVARLLLLKIEGCWCINQLPPLLAHLPRPAGIISRGNIIAAALRARKAAKAAAAAASN